MLDGVPLMVILILVLGVFNRVAILPNLTGIYLSCSDFTQTGYAARFQGVLGDASRGSRFILYSHGQRLPVTQIPPSSGL